MTDEKKSITQNNSITGSTIQAGMINTGIVKGDVKINTGDMVLNAMPAAAEDDKAQLAALIEQLQAALQTIPAEQQADAQSLADGVTDLVETAANPDTAGKVPSKANLLKKAAENIAGVMPVVTGIALNIVAHVLKMGGAA